MGRPRDIDKMREALAAVDQFWKSNGYAPSLMELSLVLGLSAPSATKFRIDRTCEQGWLQYRPNTARSLRVTASGRRELRER